jgi:NRE family putative nickel resistance protein-like MFS transporter
MNNSKNRYWYSAFSDTFAALRNKVFAGLYFAQSVSLLIFTKPSMSNVAKQ